MKAIRLGRTYNLWKCFGEKHFIQEFLSFNQNSTRGALQGTIISHPLPLRGTGEITENKCLQRNKVPWWHKLMCPVASVPWLYSPHWKQTVLHLKILSNYQTRVQFVQWPAYLIKHVNWIGRALFTSVLFDFFINNTFIGDLFTLAQNDIFCAIK